ncbi:Stealth CR1 domain-containing protein [Weissella cibaria]
MRREENFQADIILPWVDGNDPRWNEKKPSMLKRRIKV